MYTAGPSGVVTVPCLSSPTFSQHRIARKLLGDGSVWILVTSGSLNSNSTRARTSLVPKPLPSCDAFASDWSIRVLLDRFLLPCPSPLPRATYDWAYPIGSPFNLQCGVTDSCLSLGKYCFCTSASVGRTSSPAPPLDDMRIGLATHRASSRKVMLSHEAQCDWNRCCWSRCCTL